MSTLLKQPAAINFNKTTLPISLFIFICTFAYWFISAASPLSMVNLVLQKRLNSGSSFGNSFLAQHDTDWIIFYTHLIIDAIGLLIYFKSGFPEWMGAAVSRQYQVASFFYKNAAKSKRIVYAVRTIALLLLLLCAYLVFAGLIAGDSVPTGSFSSFLIIFFIGTIAWFVSYPELFPDAQLNGSYDHRDKAIWIKLTEDQIAYVESKETKEQWNFFGSNQDVDLSYRQVYIFRKKDLSHKMANQTLITSDIGNIEGSVDLKMIERQLKKTLDTDDVKALFALTSKVEFASLITHVIQKNNLKDEINIKYELIDSFSAIDPRNDLDEWSERYNEISKQIRSLNYENSVIQAVRKELENLSGNIDIFELSISLTKNGPADYFRDLQQKLEKMFQEAKDQMNREREILLTALAEILKRPGLPLKDLKEIVIVYNELSLGTPKAASLNKGRDVLTKMSNSRPVAAVNDAITKASGEIGRAIMVAKIQKLDHYATKELIAESSSYLHDSNIAFDTFYLRLSEKWANEKEERTEEAYQLLVKDTIESFLIEQK